jgi:polyisoprenoid-binding protein YceI
MPQMLKWTALLVALWVVGCANPADDKPKAVTTEAKPEESAPKETATPTTPATGTEATPAANAKTVPISSADSKIEFIGSKVTGSHNGGFKSFTGTAELNPEGIDVSKLNVEIDMDSTWADNEKLTGHLKSPDFFDVAKFPKATFVTTEIKPGESPGAPYTITGNLTLHGVTKSISFPATVKVNGDDLTINSEFSINRKDFGIVYPGKSDDLIRDEVVIKIDVKNPKKV